MTSDQNINSGTCTSSNGDFDTDKSIQEENRGGYHHVSLYTCMKLSKFKRIIIIIYEYQSSNLNIIIPLIESSQ